MIGFRGLVACLPVALFLLGACGDDPGPSCLIEGTYSATVLPESGNCPVSTAPVADTISALPNGKYRLQIQGLTGGCDMDRVEACKLSAKCDLKAQDVLTPGSVGTAQYAWTFTDSGFTGFSAIVLPAAKSMPAGCSGTAKVTGIRR